MLNALQSYQFGAAPLRVVQLAGEPWFIANDVAATLGYRDAPNMVRVLDDDEAATHLVSSSGQGREMIIISESGLYHAIFKSRRPEAQAFRKWVTSEVLPSIRRTGGFSMADAEARVMTAKLRLVSEARNLGGKEAGLEVWEALNLPKLPPPPSPVPDALTGRLEAWLTHRGETTVAELLTALDIEDTGAALHRRIGLILRGMGWMARTVRRRGVPVKLFQRVLEG